MSRSVKRKSKTGAVKPAAHDLSAVPATALAAELRRLQALQVRYDRIMARATKLRQEIEALGGSPGRSGGRGATGATSRRPRNAMSLVDVLKRVLAGNSLSVNEAAQKAVDSGYRSSSASFRQIVSQTLSGSDQFERVGRGRYALKQI